MKVAMTRQVARLIVKVALGACALPLSACSDPPSPPQNFFPSASPTAIGQDGVMNRAAPTASQMKVAVTHTFTLRLRGTDVEAVQRGHLQECAKLGCTVLSTRLDRSNEGQISARLSVRISPEGYAAFAEALAAPPAEIMAHSESAEDKTIPILDVEKRVEVKSALRDRLAAMLRDPGTKSAADLAAIEKELAQVQGDIEAAIAQRDYLRTLTETVRVDVTYIGLAAQAGGIDFYPIKHAATEFGQTVVRSVAVMVSFLAATLPWIPLLGLAAWAARRGLRRWQARRLG